MGKTSQRREDIEDFELVLEGLLWPMDSRW